MGELNVFNLQEFIDKYNTRVFVEAGTGIGFGLSYAVKFPFKKLYSIEIMEKLYKGNLNKFDKNKVKLYLGSSIDILPQILKEIDCNDNILFWLDAHFPGADYQMGSYDDVLDKKIKIPLEDELNLISSIRPNKDVFIIDDLRLYEDGNYELGNFPKRKQFNLNGIGFIYNLFSKTHNITKNYRHQGFIILTPK